MTPVIPHPPHRVPVLGDIFAVRATSPTITTMSQAEKLGPIFQMKFLNRVLTIVTGADLVTELNDEKRFRKNVHAHIQSLRPIVHDGLFTAYHYEPNWSKAHNILMPAFTQSAMRSYHRTMLGAIRELIAHWDDRCGGAPVEITADMNKVTLETIGRTGFGYNFRAFHRAEPDSFVTTMIRALTFAQREALSPPSLVRSLVLHRAIRRQEADVKYLADVVDAVIRERRAAPDDTADDLLALMMSATDPESGERLDEANIRDQVLTFLVAGHETTSSALAFALYFLSQNPDIANKARAEVYDMWPAGTDPDPSFEQIPRLRYLRRVLDETLRLWPTVPGYAREARADTVLGNGFPMKAGEAVLILLPQVHRDPVWGEDPTRFDPDRFLPENTHKRPPHIYKPFGTGLRSCIGRQFALHESIMALALLLHRYDLHPEPGYTLKVKELLTLKPDGCRLTLSRR